MRLIMPFPSVFAITFAKILWLLTLLCIVMLWMNSGVDYGLRDRDILENLPRERTPQVISFPMDLEDPKTFIQSLRSGNRPPNNVEPINTKYQHVKFSPNSTEACHTDQDILILIKTGLQSFSARMGLRNTWLNAAYLSQFKDIKIKHAFIIGKPESSTEYSLQLVQEIHEYGDFIIGDFSDTYKNLTIKTMTGIRWARTFCSKFQFYIAMDDDMLVNFRNVIQFLRDPHSYPSRTEKTIPKLGEVLKPLKRNFYTGFTYRHGLTKPIRYSRSKYYLSKQEYPLSYFPAYVAGYFAIWSWEMVQNIYHLAPYVQHVTMEDVFVGIIANKLQIPIFDISDLVRDKNDLTREDLSGVKGNLSFMSKYLGVHRIYPLSKRLRLWRQANEDTSI